MQKTQQKTYNLKNDVIFNSFFSRKGNEEFLIDFLQALLKIEITQIEIQEQVNLEKLAQNEKGGRLDLQAKLNNGIIVNIELQIKNEKNMEKRTLYYGAKTLSKEVKRGEEYNEIKQIIMINILDYEMFEYEEYVSETVIVSEKHRESEIIKGMKWYFIELPKFRKTRKNMEDKLNQWLVFIDDYDKGEIEMAEKKNKTIERARGELNYLTGDAEMRRLAELREKWEMDYISAKADGFSDGREEGRQEGLEVGRQEGIEEGRQEGLEMGRRKGLEEGRQENKLEIAKQMIEDNVDKEKIIKYTGLSKEEIEKLKYKINTENQVN